ncbi:MAG: alpha/beta hydrolase [Anaerolineales bacterium]|jgi:pimeloyl-ACP methyl ester carboxylesterase|nr:alpha/beta hydrolase [Anaerolineales bacterium]
MPVRGFLQLTDHELYYEIHAPAQAISVICIHHGLGSLLSWRYQVDALRQAGCKVILYDRWGYGRSSPRGPYSIPGFEPDLIDLAQLVDQLVSDRVILIGHSDGGSIGLLFAARYPDKVVGLVSLAAHAYLEPKMEAGIRESSTRFHQDGNFRAALQRHHGEKFAQVFEGWSGGWLNPINASWDIRPELARISCPALILQGLEDEHATPQHARAIADSIRNADLFLSPGSDHMMQQKQADLFNRRLVDFMESICLQR